MACPLSADDVIGPAVHGCRNNFDFTLLFEQSFFQIAPCAVLLLLVPFRTSHLRRQSVKILRTKTQTVKQIAITLLACTQLALLISWSVTPTYRTRTSIPAAVISLVTSAALLVLSSMEHIRSIRPSSIINAFILFSMLLDIPQARTLWLRPGPRSIPAIFTTALLAKTVILCVEGRSKRASLIPVYRLYAPEALASLYSRTALWWLNPLFIQGYRSLISLERLDKIDNVLLSANVEDNFQNFWARRRSGEARRPLFWTLVASLKWNLLALMVPRLCLSALKLSQPLLIHRITSLLSQATTGRAEQASHGLIGGAALLYIGLAISNALYKRQLHRLLTRIRGSVITAVHSQALACSADELSDSAVLTLITADMNRISFSLQRVDDLFATPVEIGVAIFLLQQQIGVSCVAPVILSAAISIISFFNSNTAIPMQKTWLAAVQERVAYTSAVLGFPKGFKMLGLGPYLSDRIQALRVKELADYAQYRKYVTYRNCFSALPQLFAPACTLIMFTLIQGRSALSPPVAFTTLSLVALLTSPIQELIHAVPNFQTATASLDRIQAFLLLKKDALTIRTVEQTSTRDHISDGDNIAMNVIQAQGTHNAGRRNNVLRITRGEIRLGKERNLVLEDINVSFLDGSLTIVVGPVGSGKSTLLKALIGDIALDKGERVQDQRVTGFAYCAQDPWLPNESVRNLIVGQSEMDIAWYSTVIRACTLDTDIRTFPNGSDTIIGSKGVSLSGGQRQRLSLARALYSRKSIFVADDIFSGLDAKTSHAVFERIFGRSGVCRRLNCTVVLATHAVQYLKEADYIYVLAEGGRIVEQGSYNELRCLDGYINNLNLEDQERTYAEEAETEEPVKPSPISDKLEAAQQELARRTGDMAVYRYYAKSIGWWFGSIIVVSEIGFAFGMTFPDLWVRWWSEAETTGAPQRPYGLWIGIYLLLGFVGAASVFTNIWVMLVNTVPRSSAQLHKQLLMAVMKAPYSFFVKTDSGVTLNRFSTDMSLIEGELAGAVMQTLGGAYTCIGSAALIAAGAKYVGFAMPLVLGVLYAIQKFYLRTSRQLRFMELEAQAPLLTHCSETLSGVTTIRAFGWQSQTHQKCQKLLDNSQCPFYLMLCIQRWLNLVLDLTTAALAIIVVSFAISLPATSSAGSVGLSLLNILSFNGHLAYLVIAWTTLETSLGAVARCKNFESSTVSEDLSTEAYIPSGEWPHAGSLELKDVSASYVKDEENVLRDVSFTVIGGQKVGICGRSGSGKSSLLLTLLRLLDNKTGSMTLDDIDLSAVPRQVIRERVTALPQEAILVPGSLRDNIDPMRISDESAINDALEKAGLLDIIHERGGLNAIMKDLNLSQGQMQLFAVAQALLRKSKLVLLDEMTSSVDALTEDTILRLVREKFRDSTVIAIAHRLKTIVDFDKIIVMDKGRIVEIGTPVGLLATEGGVFRSMWERSGH